MQSTKIHPTINKCLDHLDVLNVDNKVKQVVYMYMETLCREMKEATEDEKRELVQR